MGLTGLFFFFLTRQLIPTAQLVGWLTTVRPIVQFGLDLLFQIMKPLQKYVLQLSLRDTCLALMLDMLASSEWTKRYVRARQPSCLTRLRRAFAIIPASASQVCPVYAGRGYYEAWALSHDECPGDIISTSKCIKVIYTW
ncbi:hypothetical protein F5X96DRAFT_443243 [Biscogniauxia mediterranea]|nr:hypothetical protein F5X96DRAFT_443243 [Biscogniauxia mediterranea]